MREPNKQYMESNTPMVSVVMPVYNAEQYLHETINSVLKQSYSNFELIMVDDCSKDRSLEILQEYAQKDSRLKIVKNVRNMGVAQTRNIGIQNSTGKYIALLDSDDVWVNYKLERQVFLLQKTQAQIVYCSYGFIDRFGKIIKKAFIVPETTNFERMLEKSVISCSTAVIDKKLLKQHQFRSEFYHEDYVLWMELMRSGAVAVGDKAVLAFYRQNRKSKSGDKLNSAVHRWRIYRQELGLSFKMSVVTFIKYVFYALLKYYG